MTKHHPTDELLFDYAAGSLTEPAALAVAGHAAWCADCQKRIAETETLGGEALAELGGEALSAGALETVLARLDEPAPEEPEPPVTEATRRILPSPLWPYVGGDLSALGWRRRGRGIETAEVPLSKTGYMGRMLRIQPGHSVPIHTHEGTEYTLVLTGAYRDGYDYYGKGDLQIADPALEHQPKAEPGEACLCFAVLDAPLKFTGPVARYLNPLIRI